MTTESTHVEARAPEPKVTKGELRSKLFSGDYMKPKRVPLKFNGVDIELKQPTVDEIMQFHNLPENKSRFAYILIHHIYIPGTDELLFDDADYDQIVAMPFTPEVLAIQEAMTGFLTSDVKSAEKN